MTIDFDAALRRRKPEKRRVQLTTRALSDLVTVSDLPGGRVALVPDTNIYIDDAAGRLPADVAALLDRSLQFHCTVCLAELAVGVGNRSPAASDWSKTKDYYAGLMGAIPRTRLLQPDSEVWAEAGLITGMLARTQNYQPWQRKECLNDALILLTASKAGLPVLSANRADFDLLQQLVPEAQFVTF